MEFSDLHEFPNGHPPSPYGEPLLVVKVGDGMLPSGLTLRAVGWLERVGFPTGESARVLFNPMTIKHATSFGRTSSPFDRTYLPRYTPSINMDGPVILPLFPPSPEGTLFETMRAFFGASQMTQPALAS